MIALPIVSALIFLQIIPTKSSFPCRDKGHAENLFSGESDGTVSTCLTASSPLPGLSFQTPHCSYTHKSGPVIQT